MSKQSTKYRSNKQEKRVAKEVEGRTVVASGSLWGSKGDVRTNDFLIECKTTEKDFYSFTVNNVWKKIEKEAIKDGLRIPVMCIDLENGKHTLAVFKHGALPIDFDESFYDITIVSNTVRIRGHIVPCEILIDSSRGLLKFVVIPWEMFLEVIEEREKYERG